MQPVEGGKRSSSQRVLRSRHSSCGCGGSAGVERLGRYLPRSPVAVERLELEPSTGEVLYHEVLYHQKGSLASCAEDILT